MRCPSPLEKFEFVLHVRKIPKERRVEIERHLAECPRCKRDLELIEQAHKRRP